MSGIETLGGTHRGCKTPRDRTQHWCGIETASSGMSLSKTCVTCDSRVVPHRSTVQAHSCLTSEFGWDPVLSARYERTMEVDIQHPRNQSGEELKPRTAWDRHPLIRPMKVWSAGIETQDLAGSKPTESRPGNPGSKPSGPSVIQIAALALETGIETRVTSAPHVPVGTTTFGLQGSKPQDLTGSKPRIIRNRNHDSVGSKPGRHRDRHPRTRRDRNPDVIGIDTPGLGIETRTS